MLAAVAQPRGVAGAVSCASSSSARWAKREAFLSRGRRGEPPEEVAGALDFHPLLHSSFLFSPLWLAHARTLSFASASWPSLSCSFSLTVESFS